MAGVLKKTTGLVGLAVCNTPHERLSILKYTEQITNEKLAMVKAAEHELILARKMRDWKPWEPLVEEPPADQWKWPI
ncbi:NADH dehydrogenase [ubiquinone] 1 alpha subcomplex subunit 5-like isoform X2 [Theropithecus gelada]|uniref:NADH dehydrogenase [ubiquinone] 1 alpha subcomplex subunit 5-like isoform X2 n=1 Tax=Theropithecus gelada TaxID=9565 RepID=UPI000DC1AF2C|nr:NADH dehydrogenase [ubiquinone] 1 alpha subcomplex subunit 5-like isoform X2 [Theropithecus gelada]